MSDASALCWLTAAEAKDGLRRGDFTSEELVAALLERIAVVNPKIEAYVTVTADLALAQARERDAERAKGRERGPLHGVPFSLKDVFCTAGIRTTAGSTLLADWVPEENATVVDRLAEAGAVLLGKVNSHEFAYGITTQTVHARTRNPWDPTRLPGGSSGGSGAAVAAGLCPFSLGTDTAGSIRNPSSWDGVAGLKPTYGRVSIHNVVAQSLTADHVGPIARSVADLALVLQAIAGHDPRDPESSPEPVPADYAAALDGTVGGFRIGVPRELMALGAEPAVTDAFDEARRVFQDLGCEVAEVSVPLLADATEINKTVIMAETSARHDEWAATWFAGREPVYGADVAEWLDIGRRITAPHFIREERRRRRLAADLRAVLTQHDLLIVPTMACVAPPIGATTVRLAGRDVGLLEVGIHFICPFSLAGLPALSVPAGFDLAGLPVGLQIVGRAFDEATVLRAGHAFERATGHHRRHPDST